MRALVLVAVFAIIAYQGKAQHSATADSLRKALASQKTDTARVWTLHELAIHYLYTNADSSMYYAQKTLGLAKKIGFTRGEIRGLNDVANALMFTSNFNQSLQLFLEALQKAEKLNDPTMLATTLGNMAENYMQQGDYRGAINYTLRSLAIDLEHKDSAYLVIDYLNLGDYYERFHKLDSALYYTNLGYQLNLQVKRMDIMSGLVAQMGVVHAGLGNDDVAHAFFQRAIAASEAAENKVFAYRSNAAIASIHERALRRDSVIHYLNKAYALASSVNHQRGMLEVASRLVKIYRDNNSDSTLKYLTLATAYKDSLFEQEKVKQAQSLTFSEQLRQQEKSELLQQQEADRRNNLQLLGIGLFIPFFFGVVLLLSRRKVKTRSVEFMGLLGLLLLFEFISLFVHPYIAKWTHHSPVLMLLILVGIAAILVPAHHRLERWMKVKLAHHPVTKTAARKPRAVQQPRKQ